METLFKLIVILLVLLVAFGIFGQVEVMGFDLGTITTHAMGTTGKSEGCHTYNVHGHQERAVNGVDADFCGAPADVRKVKHTDTVMVDTPIVETVPTVAVETVPNVPIVDTLTVNVPVTDTPEPVDNVDNPPADRGNPGNDKNVGNAGEHCHQDMCENPDGQSGEHGRSDND